MKLITVATAIFLGCLGAGLAHSDSVTWIEPGPTGALSDRTMNGVLQDVSAGKLKLEARFQQSENKLYEIPIDRVRRIEFNARYFNQGAAPKVSALAEGPQAEPPAPVGLLRAYAIELRGSGGDLVPCKVTSIDKDTVRCEAQDKSKPKEYPRDSVLRILVRGN